MRPGLSWKTMPSRDDFSKTSMWLKYPQESFPPVVPMLFFNRNSLWTSMVTMENGPLSSCTRFFGPWKPCKTSWKTAPKKITSDVQCKENSIQGLWNNSRGTRHGPVPQRGFAGRELDPLIDDALKLYLSRRDHMPWCDMFYGIKICFWRPMVVFASGFPMMCNCKCMCPSIHPSVRPSIHPSIHP